MPFLDYLIPSSITTRLTDLLLGQQRIEARLAVIESHLQHSILTGEKIMQTLTELKDLASAESLKGLSAANDAFQASLNPPPAPAEPVS